MDKTTVLFSELSPGKYNFKIKAMNSNGIVSESNELSFKIKMLHFKKSKNKRTCVFS